MSSVSYQVVDKPKHNCGLFRFPDGTAVAPECVQLIRVADADQRFKLRPRVIVHAGGSVVPVEFDTLQQAVDCGRALADVVDYARTGTVRLVEPNQEGPNQETVRSLWEQYLRDVGK